MTSTSFKRKFGALLMGISGIISCASVNELYCRDGMCSDPAKRCINGICMSLPGVTGAAIVPTGAGHDKRTCPHNAGTETYYYDQRSQRVTRINGQLKFFECWHILPSKREICPLCGQTMSSDVADRDKPQRQEGPECDEWEKARCTRP